MVIQSEEIRARQAPLKERYRQEPAAAKIRLEVKSDPTLTAEPMLTRVGNELLTAESAAHAGVGGPGNVGCSGDVLLAALAACQEITLKLVASAMGIQLERVQVTARGDLDLRGTLGLERDVPVGFESIECEARVKLAPGQNEERAQRFFERAEQYCVVLSTLRQPNDVRSKFVLE